MGGLIGIALVVLLGAADAVAEPASRIYRPQHRAAEALVPLARSVLADRGSAVDDAATNTIVLSGEAEWVDRAYAALEAQDRALRTVVVHTEVVRIRDLASAGYEIDWSPGAGPMSQGRVRVTGGPDTPADGRRIYRSRLDEDQTATLRIVEGETGKIRVGRGVPVRSRGLVGTTILVEADSGLIASPRVLPDDRVRVDLTPYLGDVDPGGAVSFAETATTVIVEPGETVAVAALETRRGVPGGRVFSTVESRASREGMVVLLRVDVE